MAIEEKEHWLESDLFQLKTDHVRNPIIFHPFWNCYPVSIPRHNILLIRNHSYHLDVSIPLNDSIFPIGLQHEMKCMQGMINSECFPIIPASNTILRSKNCIYSE